MPAYRATDPETVLAEAVKHSQYLLAASEVLSSACHDLVLALPARHLGKS
jgi:hypothetical protein